MITQENKRICNLFNSSGTFSLLSRRASVTSIWTESECAAASFGKSAVVRSLAVGTCSHPETALVEITAEFRWNLKPCVAKFQILVEGDWVRMLPTDIHPNWDLPEPWNRRIWDFLKKQSWSIVGIYVPGGLKNRNRMTRIPDPAAYWIGGMYYKGGTKN